MSLFLQQVETINNTIISLIQLHCNLDQHIDKYYQFILCYAVYIYQNRLNELNFESIALAHLLHGARSICNAEHMFNNYLP